MTTPAELEQSFWTALRTDMTVMLGCDGAPPRPMTAQMDGAADTAPIWFFTATDTEIGQSLDVGPKPGIFTFVSKGHDVWASASGTLRIDNDPAVIERLWNPFVSAWYKDGKTDPKLCLVRFDAIEAQIWESGSSIVAGLKLLMGSDPKEDFADKSAHVRLDD